MRVGGKQWRDARLREEIRNLWTLCHDPLWEYAILQYGRRQRARIMELYGHTIQP